MPAYVVVSVDVHEAERYAGAEADEVERAQGRLVATARHLYEMGHVSTYLGSVPGPAAGAPPEAGGEPGDEEGGGPKAEAEAMTEPLPSQRPGRRRLWLATGLASAALAAAGVAGMVLGRGQASAPPQVVAGGSHGASGRLGAPVSGSGSRVAVGRARPAVPGARRLAPGEVLRTGDVDAVLEFSGRDPTAADAEGAAAVVEVSADSEVQRPDLPGEAPEESGDLYLRVGRVRVVVARGEFTVRTPVARLGAGAGAVFRVRVVLDGTSEVRVEEGVVALHPSQDPTVALALGPGQGRRVRPARQ